MDKYHITYKSSLNSILKNGLVPNIGKNSRSVKEQNFLVYFTTHEFIETWIERFNLDKNQIVILKFPHDETEQRYDGANDCFTCDTIPPEIISVVNGSEELPLVDFYQKNKPLLDLETRKNATVLLKTINDRFEQIASSSLEPEDGWDYNEVDPNLIDIIDVLKMVRDLDDKTSFADILNSLKKQTLEKLCANNLEITPTSELYKLIDTIFNDSLSNNPQLDLMFLNVSTVLVSVNLLYRQLGRYNRTSKKYGDDNRIWNIDTLEREPISEIINNNSTLKGVLDETIMLIGNKKRHK